MANTLKINSTNCPAGIFTFTAITGKGILNESITKEDVYEYIVTLEADIEVTGPLMDEIDDFIEDNSPRNSELIKVPYQTTEDYEGIPEGKVWIYAKATTTREEGKTGEIIDRVINVYDSQGNKVQLPEGTGIGKGSTGKTLGNMTVWEQRKEHGATIWLTGVQIADFVPYEFEEAVVAMEGGSFKGFNAPQLEKDEAEPEATPERSTPRRSRRGAAEDATTAPTRRSRRSRD